MGNFNRDRNNRDRDRRGNDRGFNRRGPDRGFRRGGGNFGRPDMHQAICDDCGQSCEVPFRPTGDKPLYCSSCFEKKGRGGSRSDRFDNTRSPRQSFSDRGPSSAAQPNQDSKEILKAIKTLNYKVDQLMKVLAPETVGQEEVVASEAPLKTEAAKAKTTKKKSPTKKPANKKPAAQKTGKKKKISKK